MNENNFIQYMRETYTDDELKNIAHHGCASGCANTLIYYRDTSEAYAKYADDIHNIIGVYMESAGTDDFEILIEYLGSAMQWQNGIVWLAAELVAYDLISEFID